MKTAIMQPYFLPYIGYWQLINTVEQFVILDDVNFIKRGFINRNSILLNGEKFLFSIPINKVSQNRLIKDTELDFSLKEKNKFIDRISFAYSKAQEYRKFIPILKEIIYYDCSDLTTYIGNSISVINEYIGIKTKILHSSDLKKDNSLVAQARIIDICKVLQTDEYINPIGGKDLYSKEAFEKENISLHFLESNVDHIKYKQFDNEFQNSLSILDVLMFNNTDQVQVFLEDFKLV